MTKRFIAAWAARPMRALALIAALLVAVGSAGCVTCHCRPLANGDCTCPSSAPGAR